MCKPASEGGQRCAAHTRAAVAKAEYALADAQAFEQDAWGGDLDNAEFADMKRATRDAEEALMQARIEHASTPTGREEYVALAVTYPEYAAIVDRGDHLREKNQAVAAALKDAAAAKAAKAEPQPTRPDGKMVTGAELNYGDRFIDPDSGDVVEVHRSYPWNGDGRQIDTAAGWSVVIKGGQKVERVPDETETTGETFGDFKADQHAAHHPNAITEDEFDTKYSPVGDGEMTDDPPVGVDTNRVWTIVEGEQDYQYAVPGVHKVNALGYIQTENPWVTGAEEAIWVDGSEFMD